MDEEPWDPQCTRPDDLVRPRRIDPEGVTGPTRRQAARSRWRQTSPGLYVPADTDSDQIDQRIFEQGHRIGRWGGVGAWAVLRWRGAAYFDGTGPDGSTRPVPLVTGSGALRPDPRVVVSQAQLAPSERVWSGGIWLTTVQRALFDEVRASSSVREAVVALDMAAAAKLISVRLFGEYVAQRPAWTGVPLVREAVALASDESRSPQETRMRLVWELDADLPRPLVNRPVFSLGGRLLGVPDLLDPETGTYGEYDGAAHKGRERHRKDVARALLMREHGLEGFEVVGGDLQDRPMVAQRMRSARQRAARGGAGHRRWTLTPPEGWVPREDPLDRHLLLIGVAGMLVRT